MNLSLGTLSRQWNGFRSIHRGEYFAQYRANSLVVNEAEGATRLAIRQSPSSVASRQILSL